MQSDSTPSLRVVSSRHPIRAYAHDAVLAHQESRLQAVLKQRIAERLAIVLRERTGRPLASWSTLPPGERAWCLQEAGILVGIAESIHDQAAPTPGELRRVDAERDLRAAQRRVRLDAERLGHVMGMFRPVPNVAGYVETFCDRCGCGARIQTMTAAASIAEPLQQPCGVVRT